MPLMPLPSATTLTNCQLLFDSVGQSAPTQPLPKPEPQPCAARPTTRMYSTVALPNPVAALPFPSRIGSSPGYALNVIQAAAVPERGRLMNSLLYVPRMM